MYGIYIHSLNTVSGAEKRALKIYCELKNNQVPCKLIIPRTLFYLLSQGEYQNYIDDCIVVGPKWFIMIFNMTTKLGSIRKIFNLLIKNISHLLLYQTIKQENIHFSILHIFLGTDVAKSLKKDDYINKIILEITSPENVESLVRKNINGLKNIDHFNAVSNLTYLRASKLLNYDNITQTPIPFFSPIEYHVNYHHLWDKKENTIIFAHRLIARKNGVLFARVIREFFRNNKRKDWIVKIYGKGPELSRINEILKEEIYSGKVVVGYKTQILPELERSKIFVSLIEPDNYPSQSVLEAMYTGNALLLSNTGFTKSKFFNDNGLLCEVNFDDVLSKLILLVENENNLDIFGRKSIQILEKSYQKSIYINYIKELYKSIEIE
ncbi:glycosyltransferase [Cyanobacterium aponinum FACHB-4101]|uniref:glycosyltransferase n=1 Tax=Cyanobacterium aponinum TaxID=379064 RepID=UPI001680E2FF|nr:glycosyltransferase [Cyanobacterium aponinum]MBD2394962.1 glycosyltransferase [Cyanobacterium aponinum FACHB-4101]